MSKAPYLALDIGTKRTGVALSASGHFVRPLRTIDSDQPHYHALSKEVAVLCKEHDISTLVIGLPLTQNSTDTRQRRVTESIIVKIKSSLTEAKLTPEIHKVNEFGSTAEARIRYPDVDKDAAAAAILLEHFLDEQHS